MSPLKHIVLGALALGALAIGPGTAEASMTNYTATWCRSKGTSDQIIVEGAFASLIFKADGDLVLQPTNRLVSKIWSSGTAGTGTAGTGAKVCWTADGTLTVHDAAGGTLWSKGGGTLPDLAPGEYAYQLTPSLAQCDLSARYKVYGKSPISSPFPTAPSSFEPLEPLDPLEPVTPWNSPVIAKGTLWTRAATCPAVSESVVGDDWCLDDSAEREILQTPSSRLVWKQGYLALVATGIREGQQIWATSTAGAGKELCLEPSGRLAIFDALRQPIWSTTPDTVTTSSHLLELDGCDLAVKRADGSASPWTRPQRCPQTTMRSNTQVTAGTADVVLLENAQARLAFQPDGNLVLRAANGDEVWHSALPPGRGKRLAFQSDGNLVIYDAANVAAWGAKMWNQGIALLELDGCAFSLKTWTETKWSRGAATCPTGVLTNTPAWSIPASGTLTLLRTPESRLVWQGDGNLVLYTASGAATWSSNTWGAGKALSFQADGNLVVYRSLGTSAPSEALWASGTWDAGGADHALRLGDHCTLTMSDLSGANLEWTGNDVCTVANYTFERGDGDGTFGSALRTHLTAKDNGIARLDSNTSLDVTLLGSRVELLAASGYQTEGDDGSDLDTASITIDGESVSVNVTYEQTFFERSQTFNVGPVPVFVSVGASGELGLGLSFGGGALTVTPRAGIYATVQAGVGGECDLGGASAGVRGSLTLIEVGLPILLKLYLEGGQPKFTLEGDLTLASLSGELSLYAEAYVKICSVKVSADWSKKLFRWTGVEWTKRLFSKSGTF